MDYHDVLFILLFWPEDCAETTPEKTILLLVDSCKKGINTTETISVLEQPPSLVSLPKKAIMINLD